MAPCSMAGSDKLPAGRSVCLFVGEPLRILYDDLVLHPSGIGEALHFNGVSTGDTGSGLEHEPARRTTGYEPGLSTSMAGQDFPGLPVEFRHLDKNRGGVHHRLKRFRAGPCSAEATNLACRIDDGLNFQPSVVGGWVPSGASHQRRLCHHTLEFNQIVGQCVEILAAVFGNQYHVLDLERP